MFLLVKDNNKNTRSLGRKLTELGAMTGGQVGSKKKKTNTLLGSSKAG